MEYSKTARYRIRLSLAKVKRRMVRSILLRLSWLCVNLSKRQLSLLMKQERTMEALATCQQDRERARLERSMLENNLLFPMSLRTQGEQELLEDMQLLHRRLITRLRRTD